MTMQQPLWNLCGLKQFPMIISLLCEQEQLPTSLNVLTRPSCKAFQTHIERQDGLLSPPQCGITSSLILGVMGKGKAHPT